MTRSNRMLGVAFATVSALSIPLPAFAQATGPTREEVAPATQAPQAPSRARVDQSGAFQAGPCPLAESDVRTTIREVRFTSYGGAPLPPEIANLLTDVRPSGVEEPIRAVCDLRDQAAARLRQSRYVASVQVPQQRIGDGVLNLEVVTGRIVEVRVRGDAGPYQDVMRSRIEALQAIDPLNEAAAERILLLADDMPGLDVQLGLAPTGGRPGDLVGELTLRFHRVSVVANVQNYNSKFLGREAAYVRGEIFGLTGRADRSFIAASSTFDFQEQKILQLGHSQELSSSGTRLSITTTLAQSRPDLVTLDLRTTTVLGNLEVTQPLVRSLNRNANATLGFEYAMQRTRVYTAGGAAPLNRDRISTFYARVDGSMHKLRFDGSQKAAVSGSLELRQGIGILGATKTGVVQNGYTPSRFEGSARTTVIRGQVDGVIGMGPIFELAASARGQWAGKPLLNYDEFALGNLTVGRGYDPGANTGDRAVAVSLEARANVPVSRDFRAQVFAFYDGVRLWNLDSGSTEAKRYLDSVGGGVRVTMFNSMRLDVTYAHPMDPPLLTGTNIRRPGDRVLVSLTAQLVPFGSGR